MVYIASTADTSIKALGYAAKLKARNYPEREPSIEAIEPSGFNPSLYLCAPRNFILRQPWTIGRYPTEFFQLAFFGLQGKFPPLHKFCTPTVTGTGADPSFWLDENDASLKYRNVVKIFNSNHQDITEQIFLFELLEEIWESNGAPLTAATLARDTASAEYLVHAKAAMSRWKPAMAASNRLLLIQDLENDVNKADSDDGSKHKHGSTLMDDIQQQGAADKKMNNSVQAARGDLSAHHASTKRKSSTTSVASTKKIKPNGPLNV